MIRYGYSLERDEGDEIRPFGPNKEIPTELPNIVLIEGPNSSGKSTLLTMLAAGFFGLKVEKLNESLRNKMRDLIESKDQKLSFEISLTSRDGGIQLTSSKSIPDDPEIIVEEVVNGGKKRKLAFETFDREYNLIYDIPDDPLERLNKLVEEVSIAQKSFAMDISAVRRYLHEIITQISDAGNPEAIKESKKRLAESRKEVERRDKELSDSKEFLHLLEKYSVARSLRESLDREDHLSKQHDTLALQRMDVVKSGKKSSDKANRQRKLVNQNMEQLKTLHYDLATALRLLLPRSDRNHLDIWNRIDFDNAMKRYEFPASLSRESRTFHGILSKILTEDTKKVAINAKIYSEMIEFLDKYKHSRIIIPGVDKPMDDFIEMLKESRDKYKTDLTYAENVDQAMRNLDSLDEIRIKLEGELGDLAQLEKTSSEHEQSTDVAYDEIEDRISKCDEELEEAKAICKESKMDAAKQDVNEDNVNEVLEELMREKSLRPYMVYKEKQLANSVDGLSRDLSKSQENLSRMKTQLSLDEKELARLEKIKPHDYADKLPQLNKLLKQSQELEGKFAQEFDQYASALSGTLSEKKLTKPQAKYYQQLSQYLAKRLGKVRHIDREHSVKAVDLIRKEIRTDKDKIIPFIRMGTGQSQSTYITSLLSTPDRRKIIALFDEVAAMDDTTLETVFEKLRELHDSGRLIAGVVVQKANTIKVTSKV